MFKAMKITTIYTFTACGLNKIFDKYFNLFLSLDLKSLENMFYSVGKFFHFANLIITVIVDYFCIFNCANN